MKKRNFSAVLSPFIIITFCLCLASCGGGRNGAGPIGSNQQVAQSDKTRDKSPVVGTTEFNELVAGNTAFALDLYRHLIPEEGNLFFSPYSISLAMAMTYAGARTETAEQMSRALVFALPQERLHPTFNFLDLELSTRGNSGGTQTGTAFKLNIANALWGQSGYSFLPGFLDTLAVNYGAGMRLLDFYNAPEPSRETINLWVEDQTSGKIKDLLQPGSITNLTRLVLTNAIYFNAAWAVPFDKGLTREGAFTSLWAAERRVQMMKQEDYFNYAEGEDYQAIELPYEGRELSMVVMLPREGRFRDFEAGLTPARLTVVVDSLSRQYAEVTMPKFSCSPDSISLKKILSEMGMPLAFTDSADFSGMDGTRRLSIGDVVHKAFIRVDEDGTEAAAATAVIVGITGVPTGTVRFSADHPFIYLIRDVKTGTILFMGRVVDLEG